jgi:hypothetical protein
VTGSSPFGDGEFAADFFIAQSIATNERHAWRHFQSEPRQFQAQYFLTKVIHNHFNFISRKKIIGDCHAAFLVMDALRGS